MERKFSDCSNISNDLFSLPKTPPIENLPLPQNFNPVDNLQNHDSNTESNEQNMQQIIRTNLTFKNLQTSQQQTLEDVKTVIDEMGDINLSKLIFKQIYKQIDVIENQQNQQNQQNSENQINKDQYQIQNQNQNLNQNVSSNLEHIFYYQDPFSLENIELGSQKNSKQFSVKALKIQTHPNLQIQIKTVQKKQRRKRQKKDQNYDQQQQDEEEIFQYGDMQMQQQEHMNLMMEMEQNLFSLDQQDYSSSTNNNNQFINQQDQEKTITDNSKQLMHQSQQYNNHQLQQQSQFDDHNNQESLQPEIEFTNLDQNNNDFQNQNQIQQTEQKVDQNKIEVEEKNKENNPKQSQKEKRKESIISVTHKHSKKASLDFDFCSNLFQQRKQSKDSTGDKSLFPDFKVKYETPDFMHTILENSKQQLLSNKLDENQKKEKKNSFNPISSNQLNITPNQLILPSPQMFDNLVPTDINNNNFSLDNVNDFDLDNADNNNLSLNDENDEQNLFISNLDSSQQQQQLNQQTSQKSTKKITKQRKPRAPREKKENIPGQPKVKKPKCRVLQNQDEIIRLLQHELDFEQENLERERLEEEEQLKKESQQENQQEQKLKDEYNKEKESSDLDLLNKKQSISSSKEKKIVKQKPQSTKLNTSINTQKSKQNISVPLKSSTSSSNNKEMEQKRCTKKEENDLDDISEKEIFQLLSLQPKQTTKKITKEKSPPPKNQPPQLTNKKQSSQSDLLDSKKLQGKKAGKNGVRHQYYNKIYSLIQNDVIIDQESSHLDVISKTKLKQKDNKSGSDVSEILESSSFLEDFDEQQLHSEIEKLDEDLKSELSIKKSVKSDKSSKTDKNSKKEKEDKVSEILARQAELGVSFDDSKDQELVDMLNNATDSRSQIELDVDESELSAFNGSSNGVMDDDDDDLDEEEYQQLLMAARETQQEENLQIVL